MKYAPITTIPAWLINSCTLPATLISPFGHIITHNTKFNNLFGIDHQYFDDLLLIKSIPAQTRSAWTDTAQHCIAAPGRIHAICVQNQLPDGTQPHFQWLLMGITHDGVSGILCIGMEQIMATAESAPPLHDTHILESITDGLYVIDRNFRCTYANQAFSHFIECEKLSYINNFIWEIFPYCSPDLQYPARFLEAALSQQTTSFESYNCRLKAWFRVTLYPSPMGITVIFRDITDGKLAKDKIRDSENKLRAILNSTLESNFLVGPDYKILSFNKFAHTESRKQLGIELFEGLDIRQFVLPSVMETFLKDFRRALQGEHLLNDILLDFPTGDRWYKIGFSPAFGKDNTLIGVSFVAADIDDFKRSQLQVAQQYRQLREIADIQSHLVRRPLASILGLLSLIDPCDLDPKTSEIIDLVHYATYELDTIIHDIVEKT